ncbi:hypothetical protein ACTFIR_007547 [Dictyostelium discoideum]
MDYALVIMDDIIDEKNLKNDSVFQKIFTLDRHKNIALIILTQYAYAISATARGNTDYVFSTLQLQNRQREALANDYVNSSGNNTTGNSSNSKSSSGSNSRSNNFNGSPSNVASGSNNTKSTNEEQEVNFTMLLRPVLRMLRDINVSVIAYLDDLLIVCSTKEECLSNLKKTMDLLVKLGFKLNLEKSVLEPTQSITFLGLQIDSVSMKLLVPKEKKKSIIKEIRNFLKLDCCSPRKLAGLKGKLIALKDAVIPFRLYTHVKSEISHWLTVLDQWNGKEISLFPSYDYVLTTDASESGAGATLKKGNKTIKTWSFHWSTIKNLIY